jgi:hypothetical protein
MCNGHPIQRWFGCSYQTLKYMILMMYIVYTPTLIKVKSVLPVCRPKVECLIWSTAAHSEDVRLDHCCLCVRQKRSMVIRMVCLSREFSPNGILISRLNSRSHF